MRVSENTGSAGGGGFLRILGIIYLIKLLRRGRERRRQGQGAGRDAS